MKDRYYKEYKRHVVGEVFIDNDHVQFRGMGLTVFLADLDPKKMEEFLAHVKREEALVDEKINKRNKLEFMLQAAGFKCEHVDG